MGGVEKVKITNHRFAKSLNPYSNRDSFIYRTLQLHEQKIYTYFAWLWKGLLDKEVFPLLMKDISWNFLANHHHLSFANRLTAKDTDAPRKQDK